LWPYVLGAGFRVPKTGLAAAFSFNIGMLVLKADTSILYPFQSLFVS
jgi:hypothetical protein